MDGRPSKEEAERETDVDDAGGKAARPTSALEQADVQG